MTLPHERTLAVMRASEFMRDLMDPKKTPRVPLEVRLRAARVLKHYPLDSHLWIVSQVAFHVFAEPE